MTPEDLENFKTWGQPLPSREAHGTPEQIRSNLEKLKPTGWRLEGNKLIAQTAVGELVNFIPTDVILMGTDKEGMPIFKKVVS